MIYTHEYKSNKELKIDCEKCFGLCCVALYFSAAEGFPTNKDAGKPCINLQSDFKCSVHKNLRKNGLKGCTAYHCFGAGQKVSQVTYGGKDWRRNPETAKQMFDVFLIMRQLHEMIWYLTEAFILQTDQNVKVEISSLLNSIEALTLCGVDSLLTLDIDANRTKVNILLKNTSDMVRAKACSRKKISSKNRNYNSKPLDYFGADLRKNNLKGADLRKNNLKGADLRGACLIAANLRGVDLSGADFIGADLRDADLSGANLTNSIFLTQAQLNTAKGDSHTKLPMMLVPPTYWSK
ncbi:pentapeptide repeat-containing protein [Clostridium arbusti]|uniref:pentapeptide repeat-containing protein n=1 Tax=Clostridium arbusti TaxID=1137848 RepID=UPI00028A25B1|nr:pentapeptide repeat-containing protein [Clostridium arbusti]